MVLDFSGINELTNRVEHLKKQVFVLSSLFLNILINDAVPNAEERVRYDYKEAWNDYCFAINKVIYRIEKCLRKLETIKECFSPMQDTLSEGSIIQAPQPVCDILSYEFEDLVIATWRIIEEGFVRETAGYLKSKGLSETFRKAVPVRSDAGGLYWRLKILRNRAAHSTSGRYSREGKNAIRYMSLISKIRTIDIVGDAHMPVKMQCELIDCEHSEYIKELIQKEILDKGDRQTDIFELLFQHATRSRKEHFEDNPYVLYISNLARFDYYTGFLSIANQMIDFVSEQVAVFLQSARMDCSDNMLRQKWIYEDSSISVADVFKIIQ